MSKIIDAVSIVITCGSDVFAIQRQFFLKAFPGYWAFPGGKVEVGDEVHCPPETPALEGIDPRLIGAVIREGEEELGLNFGVLIQQGKVNRVDFLGLAVTPDFNPYRFATYFYRIDLKEKLTFTVDTNEARFAEWMDLRELLKRYNDGVILAVPPVVQVIEVLGQNPQVRHIEDLNFHYDATKLVPVIESLKSVRQIMPLSNTLPPATRTNAFLIGDGAAPFVLVDPSPGSEEEYQKFKNTIAQFAIHKILLTHQHPDHHEHAPRLARELGVPVLMSLYTREKLERDRPGYFSGLEVQLVSEGYEVTSWLGRKVRIFEVPGHDEGQIALAPDDLSWFIAGDLFQGVGTVVIGGEEGDMAKYFQTLERIITLSPKVVFPSHGIGLGGVSILERTLEHRRVRENQIHLMHQQGQTEDEMLQEIYKDVDKRLWPYAAENIRKHLSKLADEGRI